MSSTVEEILEYIKSVMWREGIVVEYSSSEPIHLIFKWLVGISKKITDNILVLDVLDVLSMLKLNLDVAGKDTSFIHELDVIKIGGNIKLGKIIGYVDPHQDITVYASKYSKILREYYETHKNIVYFLFGMEKLVHLQERKRAFELYATNYTRYVFGDEERVGIYFINRDIATRPLLLQLEEAASRVVEVIHEEGTLKIKIRKSPRLDDYGKEFKIPLEDLRHLKF
ncbi:hypothetical protein E3E22_05620 [Thermococcus sp. MV5]|uniref:DUF257 family protein n=1 Tax=Thermococcus sp. MV5 TaxID=1638272 RepID=UPI0014398FD0|nr:DUF257 family protein [Thermococcus sp. MV5]NJE26105.1 hypothetical protein [Thermococcus sp. MV5]